MIWNKKFKYPQTIREAIEGERHYLISNEKLPSVTTILQATQSDEKKASLDKWKQRLEKTHLTRLRLGATETLETSAIHLDLLRALKMLNTAFTTIAYPLLKERGELLESRLSNDDAS